MATNHSYSACFRWGRPLAYGMGRSVGIQRMSSLSLLSFTNFSEYYLISFGLCARHWEENGQDMDRS